MLDLKIVCEDEKYMPVYANDTDACMDLRIKVPNEQIALPSGETVVLETGIKVRVPENHIMMVFPRSSTGFKLECMLANTVAIIDEGFCNEIKLKIRNFGVQPVKLVDGQRIAQFVILPRPKINLIQVEDNEEFRNSDRGGGFGSTDSKLGV